MSGLIALLAGFSAVCFCLWMLGEFMDWLDRRHGIPSCVDPTSHVRLLSDLDRVEVWRNEISDLPSPWPLCPEWDAPGDRGDCERTSLPGSLPGLSGSPRTTT